MLELHDEILEFMHEKFSNMYATYFILFNFSLPVQICADCIIWCYTSVRADTKSVAALVSVIQTVDL